MSVIEHLKYAPTINALIRKLNEAIDAINQGGGGGEPIGFIAEQFTDEDWEQSENDGIYTYTASNKGIVNDVYELKNGKYSITSSTAIDINAETGVIVLRSYKPYDGKVEIFNRTSPFASTLADYGILDAYTKTETDRQIETKAAKITFKTFVSADWVVNNNTYTLSFSTLGTVLGVYEVVNDTTKEVFNVDINDIGDTTVLTCKLPFSGKAKILTINL